MELALICAQQVIVLFLLIGVGTLAVKTGVLKLEHKQPLSNLLVNIVVPGHDREPPIRMEFSLEILRNLLAAFGLSILTILHWVPCSRWPSPPAARTAGPRSSASPASFPMQLTWASRSSRPCSAAEGLLYASAYVTVFNVLLWTHGLQHGQRQLDSPKAVVNAAWPHTPAHLRCPGRPCPFTSCKFPIPALHRSAASPCWVP